MECIQGTAVFQGIEIGKISLYEEQKQQVKRVHIADTMLQAEIDRYERAKEQAMMQLQKLYQKALSEAGEVNAGIFQAHSVMLEDVDYNDSVLNMIRSQKINAEYAVARTGEKFANMFANLESEYFKERSADVRDVSERVIAILSGRTINVHEMEEPSIVMAKELTPSETIQMDKKMILALVTEFGSINSHAAILARSMNIPAVTGICPKPEWDQKTAIVDGFEGKLYIDPDKETMTLMQKRAEELKRDRDRLQKFRGKETVTKEGRKLPVYANIGGEKDMESVLLNDAEGIGLLRTEFLYMERKSYPTEEEQFQIYRRIAEKMQGKKVIIRTLDIGGDKQMDYLNLEKEENPAMGYRAIRICLDRKEMFKEQLRAILRAACYGNVAVMFPMIISKEELAEAKRLLQEAEKELEAKNVPYKEPETGIMIETPAAVMISDELAKEADFFSIGTNDLTQFTLAIDRQNGKLSGYYDPCHPAILKMIKMVADNAHANHIPVGICGELGADLSLTSRFVEMGIDELSVAPAMVLPLRQKISEC